MEAFFHAPQPPPCGTSGLFTVTGDRQHDIVGLTVDHGADAVLIGLRMRATPRGAFYSEVHLRTPGHRYVVSMDRFRKQGLSADLEDELRPPKNVGPCGYYFTASTGLPCDGLVADVDSALHTLQVTVPRSCIGEPTWVKVGARFQGAGSPYLSDYWGDLADAPSPFVGPLSPKVRVTAS